jgi:hypothetical protein
MNTDSFITNFIQKETLQVQPTGLEKALLWMHTHPLANKMAQIAQKIWAGCGLLLPPHHEMQKRTFTPASYEAGRLYYQGNIPILELDYEDPRKAGIAHGFLMGKYLNRILNALHAAKTFLPNGVDPQKFPNALKEIWQTLPKEYLEEMRGVVEGYNRWALQGKLFKAQAITLEELLLIHLMPDSVHCSLQRMENGIQPDQPKPETAPAMACTAVIDKDAQEGIVFGRNMDWPSFGRFGSDSLIINRKHKNGKLSTVEVGLPGFIGTLTGMNVTGTSLAMNVAIGHTSKIKGMPAAFFNRYCLESCSSVAEVYNKIQERPPLGAYHLSAADQTGASSFHLYQSNQEKHTIREWKPQAPLFTTNCNYSSEKDQDLHMHWSAERAEILNKLFSEAAAHLSPQELERGKLVRASLALPYVNNMMTTHKVVMCPLTKRVQVAFDNSFAGNAALQELDTSELLRYTKTYFH